MGEEEFLQQCRGEQCGHHAEHDPGDRMQPPGGDREEGQSGCLDGVEQGRHEHEEHEVHHPRDDERDEHEHVPDARGPAEGHPDARQEREETCRDQEVRRPFSIAPQNNVPPPRNRPP